MGRVTHLRNANLEGEPMQGLVLRVMGFVAHVSTYKNDCAYISSSSVDFVVRFVIDLETTLGLCWLKCIYQWLQIFSVVLPCAV